LSPVVSCSHTQHLTLCLDCLFQNPDKAPTLGFTIGPALRNLNKIANFALIVLIVNAELGSASNILAVPWMLDLEIKGNFDAFITAIAYYSTDQSFWLSHLHFGHYPVS
jgi:hypothetical protein